MNPEEVKDNPEEAEPETNLEEILVEKLEEQNKLLEEIKEKLPEPPDPIVGEEIQPTPEEELLADILEKLPEPPNPDEVIEPEGLTEFEQTVVDRLANLEGVQTDYFGFVTQYGWLALGCLIGLIGLYALGKKLFEW